MEINTDAMALMRNAPTGSVKRSTPERKLLVAMIERAILDYFGNQAVERSEAANWLFSGEAANEDDPFSFVWVCGQLDLNCGHIATQLKTMDPKVHRRPQQWWKMRRSKL